LSLWESKGRNSKPWSNISKKEASKLIWTVTKRLEPRKFKLKDWERMKILKMIKILMLKKAMMTMMTVRARRMKISVEKVKKASPIKKAVKRKTRSLKKNNDLPLFVCHNLFNLNI
jgi:hypothetical protein